MPSIESARDVGSAPSPLQEEDRHGPATCSTGWAASGPARPAGRCGRPDIRYQNHDMKAMTTRDVQIQRNARAACCRVVEPPAIDVGVYRCRKVGRGRIGSIARRRRVRQLHQSPGRQMRYVRPVLVLSIHHSTPRPAPRGVRPLDSGEGAVGTLRGIKQTHRQEGTGVGRSLRLRCVVCASTSSGVRRMHYKTQRWRDVS
jgi:hypothetical protein